LVYQSREIFEEFSGLHVICLGVAVGGVFPPTGEYPRVRREGRAHQLAVSFSLYHCVVVAVGVDEEHDLVVSVLRLVGECGAFFQKAVQVCVRSGRAAHFKRAALGKCLGCLVASFFLSFVGALAPYSVGAYPTVALGQLDNPMGQKSICRLTVPVADEAKGYFPAARRFLQSAYGRQNVRRLELRMEEGKTDVMPDDEQHRLGLGRPRPLHRRGGKNRGESHQRIKKISLHGPIHLLLKVKSRFLVETRRLFCEGDRLLIKAKKRTTFLLKNGVRRWAPTP
jgi:hypothetical protein